MNTILVVDKNIEVYDRETAEWAKYDISTRRVSTMNEAITLLMHERRFLFVAINEDSLPNFLSQLHVMRDTTDTLIFVVTSSYSVKKEIQALQHGADVYSPFGTSSKETVLSGLELLKVKSKWSERQHEPVPVLTGGDIILSSIHRLVFVNDTKVLLTKNEFDVLQYLMEHRGRLMPHVRILKKIWGDDYGEHDTAVLWQTIDRLRKKLSKISEADKHIIVERGIGYIFLLK